MMRRAARAAVLAVAALLALAPVSQADPLALPASIPPQLRALLREPVQPSPARSNFESRFALKVGHGYEMAVIGQGQAVQVEIGRPSSLRQAPPGGGSPVNTSEALTFYIARGTVTRHRIAASFGKFGRVDVRFQPTGPPLESRSRRRCRGADHFTIQRGVFVGNVRFAGENDYVTARSHHVRGRVRTPLFLRCVPPRLHSRAGSLQRAVRQTDFGFQSTLSASWRHGAHSTDLFSFGIRKSQLTAALTEESLGSVALIHLGLAISKSRILTVNDALTSATLAPPAPFHGKGTYSAAPDGEKTWSGPLSVTFPGAPGWPLTGEQFEVKVDASF